MNSDSGLARTIGKMGMPEIMRAGDLLPSLMRDLKREVRGPSTSLKRWWSEKVTEDVASHTKVIGWKNGVMTIGVDSSCHMQEYEFLRKDVWEKMAREDPPEVPVDKIELKLDQSR